MGKYVNFEFNNGLAIVTVDNPPVNALTLETCNELLAVFNTLKEYENDRFEKKRVEVVILAASDHRSVFIAGADINMFLGLKTKADGEKLVAFCHFLMNPIAEFECPVICAINGLALGGGTEISLACDIRIASENARFGLTEVKLGVIPGGGGTQRLSRLVGPGRAKEMIFTGRQVDAAEALKIGLVEKVVPQGEALNEAKKTAKLILKNGPTAVKCAKMAINKGLDGSLKEGLQVEQKAFGILCETGEQIEGASAFLEKRSPKFNN